MKTKRFFAVFHVQFDKLTHEVSRTPRGVPLVFRCRCYSAADRGHCIFALPLAHGEANSF
jgi:hypothetical protein